MNDGEAFSLGGGNFDARWDLRERLRGEKCERQVRYGFAEFGSSGAVPGVDFLEAFEQRICCCRDSQQIEAGVGDGSGAVGEAD